MQDEATMGQKLYRVKVKINEMKRHLEHQDHLDLSGSDAEKIFTARGARAVIRAALHEIEELL